MKFTKLIASILCLIISFSLFSCYPTHGNNGNNENSNYDPHDQYQGNNQNTNQDTSEDEGGEGKVTYIYSVLSKVIHLPDCYHVKNIKDDYLMEYTGDITILLQKKYTICKDCLVPDDEKEEDKTEEDDEDLIAKEDATYATNKNNLVIHLVDCYTLESMSEKNLRYTNLSYEELIALKYRPCGTCMPDEYKQYKEEHPEEFEK